MQQASEGCDWLGTLVEGDPAGELAVRVTRLSKFFNHARSRAPQLRPGLDHAAYPILFALVRGECRVSTLAERVFADVSTVSRQVATLEQHGLVTRAPDPDDRRASLLQLTDDGQAFIQALVRMHTEWFRLLVHDWPADDVRQLNTYLDRLMTSAVRLTAPAPTPEG